MKKVLIIIVSMLFMAGCGSSVQKDYKDEKESYFITLSAEIYRGYYLSIIQDKETGCQYYQQQSHMEPRVDKNGKQICK